MTTPSIEALRSERVQPYTALEHPTLLPRRPLIPPALRDPLQSNRTQLQRWSELPPEQLPPHKRRAA